MRRAGQTSVTLFLALALLLVGACTRQTPAPAGAGSDQQQPAQGGAQPETPGPPQVALYVNSSEVMVFWDPSDSFSNEIVAMNNMYETLLRYDPAADKMEPVLAEGYTRDDGGQTWTFTLRRGVKFHGSGREMTAADVKKSVERTSSRGQGAAFIWDAVDTIETPDDYTVVFHLKYPAPLDMVVASGYAAFVFDVDYAESQGGNDWFNQGQDAGTGPYTVDSWTKGQDLVLTRFDAYWRGWDGKHFDKVVFRGVEEVATRQQMLTSGDADFTNQLPYDMLPSFQNHPELEVTVAPSFQNLVALINTQRLSDTRVREALALSFPYEAAVQTVAAGYAVQGRGVVPVGMWGHATDVPLRGQALDRTRALLAEAGLADRKVLITYTSGDDAQRQIAEIWSADLQKAGVTAEVRGMPWEAQWDLAKATDPAQRQDVFMMYWWPDVATPDTWHRNMFHSEDTPVFNLSYYSNPDYDALIDAAVELAGTDRAAAAAKYAEADQVLYQDAALIPVYDIQYARVKKRSLRGYVDNPAYPHVVWWYDTFRE